MQRGSSTSSLARKSKLKAYIIGLNTQFARLETIMHDYNVKAVVLCSLYQVGLPTLEDSLSSVSLRSWVSTQSNDELWTAGIKDYLSHVDSLLSDFKDVVPSAGEWGGSRAALLCM